MLLSLRAGSLSLAGFGETVGLALAFGEFALPLIGLLIGADLLAGEYEDATLVPMIALPISRTRFFLGKVVGRTIVLVLTYLAAFACASIAIAIARGTEGWLDYAAVSAGGLTLTLVCVGIGIALGKTGHGRTRAFGAALVAWIVMVFALDAIILAAVVAFAPPPPEDSGSHGYGEMAAQMEMMKLHELDDDQHEHRDAETASSPQFAQQLMVLDPVDLFRFTVLSASPTLHERAKIGLGNSDTARLVICAAWIAWLIVPMAFALQRFRQADLH